jgi:uncharacterized membrane protein YphA (DoxX/SURF4 family)/peroxiredoxin
MKILVHIARILVSIIFIFSGFVKLVDPLGSAYKFQEYFGADVLNLEFLIPYALPFSIALILAEIMLGVTLILGYLPKLTVWSLLLLMVVFLYLTWYSAYYDKVTDCGCFGDAVKLTPWETFYKNIILILLAILLVLKVKFIKPLFGIAILKWASFISFVLFLYIAYHVLVHLPLIDFRPYAVGKSIPEGMEFVGEEMPPIHDFYLETEDGENFTEKVLASENVLLVLAYNLDKSDAKGFSAIKTTTDQALKNNYEVYALSSSLNEEFEAIKKAYDFNFDVLFCDETTLKTIIRANPGVIHLENGVVAGKWNWIDLHKLNF